MLIEPVEETQEIHVDDGSTGVETEDTSGQILKPFDPTKIRIGAATLTVDLLLQRITDKALDMSPGFQRKGGIWTDNAQSRLIESMLIRIPIPALYVDATDDDRWLIVDGLQRLTALHRFATTGELKLRGLEFLTALEGKGFAGLEARYQRRIKETQLILYKIEEGTPAAVKFNIFKRINTGGLPLSSQEIRHALNQGQIIFVLDRLAESKAFLNATARGISDKRMAAQECVLRFLAFSHTPYTEYKAGDLDGFLNTAMEALNNLPEAELQEMEEKFVRVMQVARDIFGNDAFRKRYDLAASRLPVNKALFETWSVNLGLLNPEQQNTLVTRKEALVAGFLQLMQDRKDPSFDSAVSQGTGDVAKVTLRFERIARLIQEGINTMIRALSLHNFKCFARQSLELGHLTVLAGLNGAGKSSVLQALLLLRQSEEQGLLRHEGLALNGNWVQLGTAADALYEGAEADEFGFALRSEHAEANWRFAYDRAADVVRLLPDSAGDRIYEESLFGDSLCYISAERSGPRTVFSTSDYLVRRHRQLGVRGEYTAQYLSLFGDEKILQEMAHPSEASLSLKAQVEAWMSEVSPGVRLDLERYDAIDAVSIGYSFVMGHLISNRYRSTNVGFGITYTLPVVVALLAARQGALVLLENPEAHLHPRGQVKMGELMARAASAGVQVIVESHSDHILNGVRIAVREKSLTPQQVKFHFFERGGWNDQLSSRVTSPNIDADGRIDEWPEGFFDEWEKSLLRLL